MINKKAIAGIMVATIALASVAIAVSAQGEGGVGPMAIMPGAITSEHIKDNDITVDDIGSNAVGNDEMRDSAITEPEIAAYAIPRINYTLIGNTSFTDTNANAINTTPTTDVLTTTIDNKGLIIMYSANVTCAPAGLNITVKVLDADTTEAGIWRYTAIPEKVTIGDETDIGVVRTLIFYVPTVAADTYGINVTAEGKVSGTYGLYNQTLIAFAI